MAKQPKMINRVIEMLGEGKTSKEIKDEVGCSDPTISVARKRLKERGDEIQDVDGEITELVDENINSFIKNIKIKPDPDVLTKDSEKEEEEDTDYECPKCGHEWSGGLNDRQDSCPNCGEEFE